MKKSIRLISLILSAMFCLTLLLGCNKEFGELEEKHYDNDEYYKLTYYMFYNSANPPQDMATVNKAVNAIIKPLINAEVDIIPYISAEYTTKLSGAIASNTKFDICYTSPEVNPYLTNVEREAFYPSEWMLKEYAPVTYSAIPEQIWNQARVNGKIYGVVNEQIYPRTFAMDFKSPLHIQAFLTEKYGGVTTDEIYTLNKDAFDFIREYLSWLKNNGRGNGGKIHEMDTESTMQNYFKFDNLGTGISTPGVIRLTDGKVDGTMKVINQFESAEYEKLIDFVYELKEGGYLNPNLGEANYDITSESNWKPGYKTGRIGRFNSPTYFTTYIIGTMNAISSTSQNPARAMKFLELLRTNPDLHNLLQYGVENVHYIKDDNNPNRIAEFMGSGYSNSNFGWGLGSEFVSYLQPNQPDDLWEQVKKINAETPMTELVGFQFDPRPVKQKIADCRSASNEFMIALQRAEYADKNDALLKFRTALKAAGADEIIAEKQAQINKFLDK